MRYNMLYRWFVGLSLDDAVWDATTFTKNHKRFVDHEFTGRLLEAVVAQARKRQLFSEQHFCVGGTLVDAWPRWVVTVARTMTVTYRPGRRTLFGWGKFNRPLKQTMLRGLDRVGAQAKLAFASYNLVRIAALEAA